MHNFNISGLQTIKVSFFILLFLFVPPFLSPLGLPVVSPQGGDPNATSRGERFAPTRARVGGKRKRAAFSTQEKALFRGTWWGPFSGAKQSGKLPERRRLQKMGHF